MEHEAKSAQHSRKPDLQIATLVGGLGILPATKKQTNKRTLSSLHQFIENTNGNATRAETGLFRVIAFSAYLELSRAICHVFHLVPKI